MLLPYLVSGLYYFVGLLIGYIAESRSRFYALIPALLISTIEALAFIYVNSPNKAQTMLLTLQVAIALLFSFVGGLTGEYLKNQTQHNEA